jgi:glycerol kinase
MTTILAIDQGTTGTTCLVVDAAGRVRGRGYRELAQSYPAPGWVEHDPLEILATVRAAAREAVAAAGAAPSAIGITNQRERSCSGSGPPGAPCTRDRLAGPAHRTALRRAGTAIRVDRPTHRAGGRSLLQRHEAGMAADARPGAARAGGARRAGGRYHRPWLIWQLTGGRVHATEPTNASRTLLYDLERRAWSDELCALFGVPRALLPEVRPSVGDFGTAVPEVLGFAAPILGVAGDQQAALFGQGGWVPGMAKNTYGTGAFLLRNCGAERPVGGRGLLTTLAVGAAGEPVYALEAAIFVAGAAVQWLRDGLGIVEHASESEALARSVASTDGVYFVPALTGLGAPDWEPNARGTIVGLTRGTTRAHLTRAALEAMAYATADVLDAMRAAAVDGIGAEAPLRVDGGATTNEWLVQFQADVLGAVVERPAMVESTGMGAAGLAGIAHGMWASPDDFLASRRFARFQPGDGRAAAEAGRAGWRRAVRASLAWARDAG